MRGSRNWKRGWRWAAAMVAVSIQTGCRTAPRPALDERELEARREACREQARDQRAHLATRLLARMERLREQRGEGADGPVTLNILLLSSGGQYGAFGAGVLEGWGQATGVEAARPEFDLVTGVSTGALMAPFALAGNESYARISELYRQADDSLAVLRGNLFFLPWRESFYDTSVLDARIRREIADDEIRAIAAAHREHRTLLVGATNLDVGCFHIWDVGQLAEEAIAARNPSPVHDALIASASIPCLFPPRIIGGAAYADGAIALPAFVGLDRQAVREVVREFRSNHPADPIPRFRVWMIVNGHIDPCTKMARPSWLSVGQRSLAVSIGYSLRSTLRNLQHAAELVADDIGDRGAVEFRYIAIPAEVKLPEPKSRLFDRGLMREIHRVGHELGRDPSSWRRDVIAPSLPGSDIDLTSILLRTSDAGAID